MKKLIRQWLCPHKNIKPVRCVDNIEYTYKDGQLNNKSKHLMSCMITQICQDCDKKIDTKLGVGRKYF